MLTSYPANLELGSLGQGELPIHDIHPYFASFSPAVPRTFIRWFTERGDVVLDPFCGSGTSLVESKVAGRPSIGIDVNPVACLVSKVKTTPIKESLLSSTEEILSEIVRDLHTSYGQTTLGKNSSSVTSAVPPIPRIDFWFKPGVLRELSIIKAHIDQVKDRDLRDLCLVAFSAIIVKVSNQEHETRYRRVDKVVRRYEPFGLFQLRLRKIVESVRGFSEFAKTASSKIVCQDLRRSSVEDKIAKLIVTSPPYLNAWDYNLYQKFRLYWLGFDHLTLRNNEIGAHLRHSYIDNSIGEYAKDMQLCLDQMYRMLSKDGMCCIVIGESVVKGKRVDVGELSSTLAMKSGFSLERKYNQGVFGPHFAQSRSVGSKEETILILKKSDSG